MSRGTAKIASLRLSPALLSLLLCPACSGGVIFTGDQDADADRDGPDAPDANGCGVVACPAGTSCIEGQCLADDPCVGINCSNPGDVCRGGRCVSGEADLDNDSYPARSDCDDEDPAVFPGSTRVCVNGCGEGLSTCGEDARWGSCWFESEPCTAPRSVASCVEGACLLQSCESGWADCAGGLSDGCETQLGTAQNCASCGDRCEGNERCQSGACRCVPDCGGVACGEGDGCGGTCNNGSCPSQHECRGGVCVCLPDCSGAECGQDDGCGGWCDGSCPENEDCRSSGCVCPSPNYGYNGWGDCVPSCGGLLSMLGLFDNHSGCCPAGCVLSQGGGPGDTYDCSYCCEGNTAGSSCL